MPPTQSIEFDYDPKIAAGTRAWALRADVGNWLISDAFYLNKGMAEKKARQPFVRDLHGPFSLVEFQWVPPATKWEPVEDPSKYGIRAKREGSTVVSWEKGDEVEVVRQVTVPGRWEEVTS